MSVTLDKTGISVEIKTDGKDVISTGSVHVYGDTLEFTISGMLLRIKFIDEKNAPRTVKGKAEGGTLNLDVINFNNALGAGTAEMTEIGYLDNRKMYIGFTVLRMNEAKCRRFEYTFYLGDNL